MGGICSKSIKTTQSTPPNAYVPPLESLNQNPSKSPPKYEAKTDYPVIMGQEAIDPSNLAFCQHKYHYKDITDEVLNKFPITFVSDAFQPDSLLVFQKDSGSAIFVNKTTFEVTKAIPVNPKGRVLDSLTVKDKFFAIIQGNNGDHVSPTYYLTDSTNTSHFKNEVSLSTLISGPNRSPTNLYLSRPVMKVVHNKFLMILTNGMIYFEELTRFKPGHQLYHLEEKFKCSIRSQDFDIDKVSENSCTLVFLSSEGELSRLRVDFSSKTFIREDKALIPETIGKEVLAIALCKVDNCILVAGYHKTKNCNSLFVLGKDLERTAKLEATCLGVHCVVSLRWLKEVTDLRMAVGYSSSVVFFCSVLMDSVNVLGTQSFSAESLNGSFVLKASASSAEVLAYGEDRQKKLNYFKRITLFF